MGGDLLEIYERGVIRGSRAGIVKRSNMGHAAFLIPQCYGIHPLALVKLFKTVSSSSGWRIARNLHQVIRIHLKWCAEVGHRGWANDELLNTIKGMVICIGASKRIPE
jgi:hypothetical protein